MKRQVSLLTLYLWKVNYMILVLAVYVGGIRTMTRFKKYTYTQIVKIVGYKVVSKWDNDQITLGQFIEIFDKKLQEKN